MVIVISLVVNVGGLVYGKYEEDMVILGLIVFVVKKYWVVSSIGFVLGVSFISFVKLGIFVLGMVD